VCSPTTTDHTCHLTLYIHSIFLVFIQVLPERIEPKLFQHTRLPTCLLPYLSSLSLCMWIYVITYRKLKVTCTFVQALRLCTDRAVHRGSRGIALTFHNHGTRRGEGSASRPGLSLPPGKTRYPL